MRSFDVQGIELQVSKTTAFSYIADPTHLPEWASAFASVADGKALMKTPHGEIEIDLNVRSSQEHGTIDWRMTFPDRSVASAFSRVADLGANRCVFVFILTPPPVPLEQLEGALEAQSRTLALELRTLKDILERHG
ncbi:MAG: SRPBCC family protein [Gammaproteobacteria bacterium]